MNGKEHTYQKAKNISSKTMCPNPGLDINQPYWKYFVAKIYHHCLFPMNKKSHLHLCHK